MRHSTPGIGLALFLASIVSAEAAGNLRVSVVDGLRRVRPHDAVPQTNFINLKVARNEYEPFQVVISGGSAGSQHVEVEVSDLGGDAGRISRTNIALYREHYLEVTKPSLKSKAGAGWYPDALIPFINPIDSKPVANARFVGAPFEVAPESNQLVWVDVFVPGLTRPGTYRGVVKITAQGQSPVELGLSVRVWNFRLPATPSMRSNFGGIDSRVAKAHRVPTSSAEFRKIERRYAEAMAAHRLCPPIPHYLMPKVLPDGSIDATETGPGLKEWVETFHVTGIPVNLIGDDPLGKDLARCTKYLQAIYAYLKTNGWEKLAYVYVLDEPNDAKAYEEVRRRARLIHEAQPGIKVLCTEQPTPQEVAWGTLVGSVDIWVPLWTLFEPRAAAERLSVGEELWSYTALCQGQTGQDTPYWELDFPLLDYRIPAWMNWRHGVTGLLYWTTVYWEKVEDPWTNPATYGEDRYRYNGEGSLFYPGSDAGFAGPVASIRLKQIREGLEDYEYLQLLAEQGERAFAEQCAQRLARSWVQWDDKAPDLYAAREQMGQKLDSRP